MRELSIGDVVERTGVTAPTLRYYEDEGLISADRNAGGHRRYRSDVLRRVGFIRTAKRLGLSLAEIGDALDQLPNSRTPTAADWARLSKRWRSRLDDRIAQLTRLRDELDGCIGCGCLSLDSCALWNPDDAAAELGPGARYLLSEERPAIDRAH